MEYGPNYTAYEAVTVSTSAVALTSATYGTLPFAFITVETAAIRWRIDGGDPTSAVGHAAEIGDVIELRGPQIAKFKAIRRDGADASIRVSYGR